MGFQMKYEITPRYLTGPSQRRSMIPLDPCRFMVAHDTGNPGSTAASNVAYYENSRNAMSASAHLFVDDKQILECIPFLTASPEKAWHVRYDVTGDNMRYGADANDAAGSVELCYGGSINADEAYRKYCWTLAYSCYLYGLNPSTDIIGHYRLDPSRRTDPVGALALVGKSFDDFVADVAAEYESCLEPDILISSEDANKMIAFLSAAYFATDDAAAQAEFHRLANELRRVSGQL